MYRESLNLKKVTEAKVNKKFPKYLKFISEFYSFSIIRKEIIVGKGDGDGDSLENDLIGLRRIDGEIRMSMLRLIKVNRPKYIFYIKIITLIIYIIIQCILNLLVSGEYADVWKFLFRRGFGPGTHGLLGVISAAISIYDEMVILKAGDTRDSSLDRAIIDAEQFLLNGRT